MTLKEIREMLQLMKDHGLTELEVEREGMKIRLRKGISGAPQIMVDQGPMAVPVAAAEPSRESAAPTPSKRTTINSPMVGTFYAAPAPDAPAFTEVKVRLSVSLKR
jgi:acetyl-CoA carboxylase biotin carboxyl carrier protein